MSESVGITDKEQELKRKKLLALSILCVAAIAFIVTIFLPQTFTVRMIKAAAEAAVVGGLADWFAVVALFRRPLGLPIPHTAIIPNSKDRIADNLAEFVQEKFLNAEALTALIRQSDPAQRIMDVLKQPKATKKFARHAVNLISGSLDLVDDKRIQAFLGDAMRTAVSKVDVTQAAGSILEMLTKGARHQELLDVAMTKLADSLKTPTAQKKIAEHIVQWIKTEHSWKQKVLPTEWVGESAAEAASDAVAKFVDELSKNPQHELRQFFDEELKKFVQKLKTDPELQKKGDAIKEFIRDNKELNEFSRGLWRSLREWLSNDLERSDSELHQKIAQMGDWIGQSLADDPELRDSINDHLESFAREVAPKLAEQLTHHISKTVRNWDAKDMSNQIELSIGPDLQFIRINGTVVGGFIGLALFLLSQMGEMLR